MELDRLTAELTEERRRTRELEQERDLLASQLRRLPGSDMPLPPS